MNIDIRLSVGFWSHPKTKKLVKRLGLDGVRSLQILWLWTAQNKADGHLTTMDWEDIELAADWQGEEGKFFEHCLGVWIDEVDGGYVLHDWEEHNPWQAEAAARSEQARQNAKSGWKKRHEKQAQANGNAPLKQTESSGNAENMRPQCNGNATAKQAQANGNAPFLSLPNQEELKESSLRSDSFCGELSCDSAPPDENPAEKPPSPPPVISLPLNTGKLYPISEQEIAHWKELYPAVDVMQQLRCMIGWLEANPKKRKTKGGVMKFVNGWLAREQDKGGSPRASPPMQGGYPGQPAAPTEWQKNKQGQRNMAILLSQMRRNGGQNEKDTNSAAEIVLDATDSGKFGLPETDGGRRTGVAG